MGKNSSQTSTQNSKPWNKGQLKAVDNAAARLYKNDVGFNPFPDATYTPYSAQSLQGLQQTEAMARAGSPVIGGASSYLTDSLGNQGMTSALLGSMQPMRDVGAGNLSVSGQNYSDILGRAIRPAGMDSLDATARGDYLGGSPYLMDSLQRGASEIQTRAGMGAAGAGRYGSGAAGRAAGDAIGDYYRQALQGNYEAERGRQMQAFGLQQGLLGTQLNAAQGVAGVEGANIANRLNASGQESGLLNQGLQRNLQAAALAPTMDAARYNDANMLRSVGAAYEGKSMEELQDEINRYNALQARDWEQLKRYAGVVQGTGSLGSSTTTTQPGPSTLQTTMGGALSGAGLLGTLGGTAALGPFGLALPIGGALLGAFS
jgi:hypothetical protein